MQCMSRECDGSMVHEDDYQLNYAKILHLDLKMMRSGEWPAATPTVYLESAKAFISRRSVSLESAF